VNHVDRSHASVLSGSVAYRRINCPGSFFLEKDLPPQEAGPSAKEGTIAHEVAEILLNDFLEHKITGKITERVFEDVDPAIIDAASGYVETVWKNILNQTITGKAYGLEDKFTFNEQLGMFGYVDLWVCYIDDRGKRVAAIVDFKYGFVDVSAKGNAQLAFYLCAFRAELKKQGKDIDYGIGAIYQPKSEEPFKQEKFTAKQLDSWAAKFDKVAHTIFVEKKPQFKVGPWCTYCPANAVCRAFDKDRIKRTALKLVDRDTEFPTPDRLSDTQVAKILLYADKIEAFLSGCRKYAMSRFLNGETIPGIKVVEGSSRRKWHENESKVVKHLETYSVDPYRKELITITEAERLLSKSMTKNNAKDVLSGVTIKSKPGLIIVPESDARPAASAPKDLLTEIEIEE
jgi:hypothetical protein